MRRSNQAAKHFVCTLCFRQLKDCTCRYYPPNLLLFVDEKIQESVRILNEKGYRTTGSCQGHIKKEWIEDTSICIQSYYPEIMAAGMPEGFKYQKSRRTIYHSYPRMLEREVFEAEQAAAIKSLTEWCKALPDSKDLYPRNR